MSGITHVNPPDAYNSLQSRGYTQVVTIETPGRLIFVSGQLPLDSSGTVVGTGDIERQARMVFENIRISLGRAGVEWANVVKLTTYVTDIVKHPPLVRKVRSEIFGVRTPPASTMIEVPRFAHPDILIEIDAVAAGVC
jgi:enamine deaminase RidA (YjgF/YER057c/UK114 family)